MANDEDLPSASKAAQILGDSYAKGRNPAVLTLQGKLHGWRVSEEESEGICPQLGKHDVAIYCMSFIADDRFVNGKKGPNAQVQGGVSSAMLDAVCANAVVWHSRLKKTVATLEQKCTFLRPVPPNKEIIAVARLIRMGRSIAFLEAELRLGTIDGKLLVSSTQSNSLLDLVKNQKKPKL